MSKQKEADAQQQLPPEAYLTQLALGALHTQALYVAAKLGIADLLAGGPPPAGGLAAETGTHERSLYPVRRSLASVGVFRESEPKAFALTPTAELLRSGAPRSLRNGAIFMGEAWHWQFWGYFLHSVRTGKPAWGHTSGVECLADVGANPE